MSEPDDYLWDRSGPADPEVERLEKLLAPLAHDRPLDELRIRRRSRWWIYAGVVVAAAAVLVLVLRTRGATCDGFETSTGCVAVGESLDTGASPALVRIADIGQAVIAPNTK